MLFVLFLFVSSFKFNSESSLAMLFLINELFSKLLKLIFLLFVELTKFIKVSFDILFDANK